MNKLQLYIAKSLRGYKCLVSINPSDEVRRHIKDLRGMLAAVAYDPLEKNIFYLIRYTAEGTLLSILRTIPTDPLDHLEATVFVPAQSAIDATQLDETVRAITRKISAASMSADDIEQLRAIFAREWPDKPAGQRPDIAPSGNGGIAYALYGGDSGRRLRDYFGDRLYSPERLPYSATLLLDADMGLDTTATDITDGAAAPASPAGAGAAAAPVRTAATARVQQPAATAPADRKTAGHKAPEHSGSRPDTGKTGSGINRVLIASAISFFLGLLLGFCLFAGGKDEKVGSRNTADTTVGIQPAAAAAPATETTQESTQPVQDPQPAQPAAAPAPQKTDDTAEAIKYLDSNRTWNRTEMERFECLAGLFDDMNAMRLDRLRGQWAKTLKDSKNFGAIVRAAEGSARKKTDVHRNGRTTYNKPGDLAIGYVGYTYWIDP